MHFQQFRYCTTVLDESFIVFNIICKDVKVIILKFD